MILKLSDLRTKTGLLRVFGAVIRAKTVFLRTVGSVLDFTPSYCLIFSWIQRFVKLNTENYMLGWKLIRQFMI